MTKGRKIIWHIGELHDIFVAMQENKFDGIIVFDGKRGIGKSTCAVKLACRFPNFKIKRDIAFTRDEVTKKVSKLKEAVIVADEAINVVHNREFYQKEQIDLIKILNMCRDNKNLLFLCVPNFFTLDKQFRDLVKMRITVIKRGLAIVHKPHLVSYSTDQWDSQQNEKVEKKWLMKKNNYKPKYQRLSTFIGYLNFGDLAKRQRRQYEEVKAQKRNKIIEEKEIDENAPKHVLENFVQYLFNRYNSGDPMSMEHLIETCNATGKNYGSMATAIRKYLKTKGLSDKFKLILPSEKNKLKYYYSKGATTNNVVQNQNLPQIV